MTRHRFSPGRTTLRLAQWGHGKTDRVLDRLVEPGRSALKQMNLRKSRKKAIVSPGKIPEFRVSLLSIPNFERTNVLISTLTLKVVVFTLVSRLPLAAASFCGFSIHHQVHSTHQSTHPKPKYAQHTSPHNQKHIIKPTK